MKRRPLTPLELALLRAVVALGDGAYGLIVYEEAARHLSAALPNVFTLDIALRKFVDDHYLKRSRSASVVTRWCWRPAFDLTDILAATGGASDKETR